MSDSEPGQELPKITVLFGPISANEEQNVRENPYLPAKRFRFLDDLHPVAPESKYNPLPELLT